MSRTFQFTDAGIRKLPLPEKPNQLDYFDSVQRGLGVRVSYGGTKSFFVMYSDGGKRQRLSLGEYGRLEDGRIPLAVARKHARIKLGEVASNRRPAAEARAARQSPTVRELALEFLQTQHTRGRKSAEKQARMLAKDVLPVIGTMRARDVRRSDIKEIMRAVTQRGAPIEANRIHEVLRTMFAYGIDEETFGLELNPAARLERHRNAKVERERWLSLDELARYWRALDELEDGPAAALRLSLLTAQRQGNILGLRTEQVSLVDKLWIIPGSETKTGKPYNVPLSEAAAEIIKERGGSPWVFPKRGGGGPACSTFVGKPHRLTCARADIADYCPHDHRHTFATHCEQMGIPRIVWDGLLGHGGRTMADLYSGHDFADRRAECMQRWADRIVGACAPNVVSLRRA